MNSLKDKRVWITGASSGIGRALAIAYSEQGARCILSARNEENLKVTKEMCSNSDKHEIEVLDVTNVYEVGRIAKGVLSRGGIDILINNAGVSQRSETIETEISVYQSLMEVNFYSVVYLTKAILPYMIEKGRGSIVTISSIAGKVGPPFRSGYAASKHAIHGFMDSLRAEVTDKGIHVGVICPGYVDTSIAINALAADGSKYDKRDVDNANGLDPNDLAVKIVKAVQKKKNEVAFGKFEKNAILIKRIFPSLLRKLLVNKYKRDPK